MTRVQFLELTNVEHLGTMLKNRDGLAKVNSSAAMTGSVMGVADDRAMGIGGGTLAGVGTRWYYLHYDGLSVYDSGLSTPMEYITSTVFNTEAGGGVCALIFFDDGWVYYASNGVDGGSTYLYRFRPGVVTGPTDTVGSVQAEPEKVAVIDADASTTTYLTSMCKAGPYYYLGTAHNVATDIVSSPAVYKWDGKTVSLENSTALTDGADHAVVATYRDRPVVMYNSAAGAAGAIIPTVRYKADDGTWTGLTWPTASTSFLVNATCEFKDKLWWAGKEEASADDGQIYSLSGTTITKEREITNTLDMNTGFTGMVVSGGYLYFLYYKTAVGTILGRYDGTTWTNEYKTIVATGVGFLSCGPLWVQGGRMYAKVGSDGKVYSAAVTDLGGTWTLTTTFNASASESQGNGNFSTYGGYQVVAVV